MPSHVTRCFVGQNARVGVTSREQMVDAHLVEMFTRIKCTTSFLTIQLH